MLMTLWRWACRWWYCRDRYHDYAMFPDAVQDGSEFYVCLRCKSAYLIMDEDRDWEEWKKTL